MPNELNSKKVYDKLDTLHGKMDKLLLWKVEHVASHELIERDVADNRAVLFENPGVVSKVSTLWNCKSTMTERRKFWLEILKYLIVAGIVGTATWALISYKGS